MWATFDQSLVRSKEIEKQLGDPDVATDPVRYSTLAKEHAKLVKMVRPYEEYLKLTDAIAHAKSVVENESDAEMKEYAAAELTELQAKHEQVKAKLEDLLLVDPGEDFDSLIMEIRAGTGGDEAALFAGDLYEMYSRYARAKGWTVEEISFSPGE